MLEEDNCFSFEYVEFGVSVEHAGGDVKRGSGALKLVTQISELAMRAGAVAQGERMELEEERAKDK